jgi:hypothetical protein
MRKSRYWSWKFSQGIFRWHWGRFGLGFVYDNTLVDDDAAIHMLTVTVMWARLSILIRSRQEDK